MTLPLLINLMISEGLALPVTSYIKADSKISVLVYVQISLI